MEHPRHTHDCDHCVFLGRWKEFDLYHHPDIGSGENFIARYGNDGKYLSGLSIAQEQYQSALNGGMLLPLGMAITYLKTDYNKSLMFSR